MKKDIMISYLEKMQSEGAKITRLYYDDNGQQKYVEDFTPFANEKYMSKELLEALGNGKSLTTFQQNELDCFVYEGYME